jgi:hypothetical protein
MLQNLHMKLIICYHSRYCFDICIFPQCSKNADFDSHLSFYFIHKFFGGYEKFSFCLPNLIYIALFWLLSMINDKLLTLVVHHVEA